MECVRRAAARLVGLCVWTVVLLAEACVPLIEFTFGST